MTTLSVINILPETKAEIATFVKDAKERILAGFENPLKIASQLKAFEEVIKELRDDKEIKEAILKEAEKNGKSFKMFNSSFQTKEAGVKYDYTVCDDKEWSDLESHITKLSEKKKEREKFLQAIKNDIFDSNGIQINPPVKTSTTTVAITLL